MAKAKAKKKIQAKKAAPAKKAVKKSAPTKTAKKVAPAKKSVQGKSVSKVASKSTAKSTVKPQTTVTKTQATKISGGKTSAKLVDVSHFVTPLDDRMIVQVAETEKVTAGGLIIPDTVSSVSGNRKGVVLSVGRGHRDTKGRLRPMDVRKGDQVIFAEFTGSKLNYEGQDLVILRETDVMGVLD